MYTQVYANILHVKKGSLLNNKSMPGIPMITMKQLENLYKLYYSWVMK